MEVLSLQFINKLNWLGRMDLIFGRNKNSTEELYRKFQAKSESLRFRYFIILKCKKPSLNIFEFKALTKRSLKKYGDIWKMQSKTLSQDIIFRKTGKQCFLPVSFPLLYKRIFLKKKRNCERVSTTSLTNTSMIKSSSWPEPSWKMFLIQQKMRKFNQIGYMKLFY